MNEILKEIKKRNKGKNLIFNNESDVYYLTRIKSSNLSLLLVNENWYAFTDSRYFESIKNSLKIEVVNLSKKDWLKNFLKKEKFREIYIDEKSTTISFFNGLKKILKNYNINLLTCNFPYIRNLYLNQDIKILKESSKINDEIFSLIKKQIKMGMTEKEVEKLILKEIINSSAEKESFEPIVAFGSSGSNPHWHPTDKKLLKNEMITIDMGVFYKGFASDMTRTFVLDGGEPSKEEVKIFNIVKEAMESSIKMIKNGLEINKLYDNAMKIISDNGYGEYFTHSLGHGIGVEIHENPNIGPGNKNKLKSGMVITIEPGIYIPNRYGVRLEQSVLVKNNGYLVLNNVPVKLFIK